MFADIHNHSLPGVDDGARNETAAFRMLQRAYRDGIREILLTPHDNSRMGQDVSRKRQEAYQRCCEMAAEIGEDLQLFQGAELYYDSSLKNRLSSGTAPTLNGTKYVLVEFPIYSQFFDVSNAVRELWSLGYFPVLAHVERYRALRKEESIRELIRLGACIQINAASLSGKTDFHTRHFLLKLIRKNLVHVIGTDAHNCSSRPPVISECAEYLEKKVGSRKSRILCRENTVRILKGEPVIGETFD